MQSSKNEGGAMKEFRGLKVWGKAHRVTLDVYRATADFPRKEIYGLTSQVRRSVVSIATNIAEGCGRQSDADFARFLQMAMGSASEIEYQVLLARELQYLDETAYRALADDIQEVKRILSAFLKKLTADS